MMRRWTVARLLEPSSLARGTSARVDGRRLSSFIECSRLVVPCKRQVIRREDDSHAYDSS